MKTYERNDRMKAAIVINKYCVYKFIVTSCCSPANTTEDEIKKIGFLPTGLHRLPLASHLFISSLGKFCLGE